MPDIPRRIKVLEAKAGVGTPSEKPWRQVIDDGEPDIPQRIADLHAAGFNVIQRVFRDTPALPSASSLLN